MFIRAFLLGHDTAGALLLTAEKGSVLSIVNSLFY